MISVLCLSKYRSSCNVLQTPQTMLFYSLFLSIIFLIEVEKQMKLDQNCFTSLFGWQNTKERFWSCSITAGRAGGGRKPWGNSSGADLACRQPQVLLLCCQTDRHQASLVSLWWLHAWVRLVCCFTDFLKKVGDVSDTFFLLQHVMMQFNCCKIYHCTYNVLQIFVHILYILLHFIHDIFCTSY